MVLYKNDLIEILEDFTAQVKRNHYKRLPYPDWKQFNQTFVHGDGDEGVIVANCDGGCGGYVEFYNNHGEMVFPTDTNSFGEFIKNEVLGSYSVGYESVNTTSYEYDGTASFSTSINKATESLKKLNNALKKDEEENKNMKGFNFDFGPCSGDKIRMSIYGLAVQNTAGVWVSYHNGEVVDVDVFNFEGGKYMYKVPVAIKDIKAGDIVVHNKAPMFVTEVVDGKIAAVDVRAGEAKTIIPTTNMFGFNFVTKIVSMFDAFGNAPTPDQPFGNMLPFMMMSEGGNVDPMMMAMMMMNGGSAPNMMNNPMMMYFMFKDGGASNDMLPLMMMMNMQAAPVPAVNVEK